jgi:hypothetical protein
LSAENVRWKKAELDILAYKPSDAELIHVEVDGGAPSLVDIHANLTRKFPFERHEYIQNLSLPSEAIIRKVAIVGFERSQRRNPIAVQGIEVRSIRELMSDIASYACSKNPMQAAITEAFPLARMTQYLAYFSLLDSEYGQAQARGLP